jgi:hypothetical protein
MSHKFGSIACMAVLALAGQAMADGVVSASYSPTNYGNGANGGGGFLFTYVSGNVGLMGSQTFAGPVNATTANNRLTNGFISFCIERTENLPQGNSFAQISGSSNGGGHSGQQGGVDPISNATALLYRTFRAGTAMNLGGSFGSVVVDSAAEATDLQLAIWSIEGEITPANPLTITARAQAMINWATTNQTGLGGVRVLRLWSNYNAQTGVYSGFRQDQLTIVPLPPAAFAGLGTLAGVIGLGYIRRRRLANA